MKLIFVKIPCISRREKSPDSLYVDLPTPNVLHRLPRKVVLHLRYYASHYKHVRAFMKETNCLKDSVSL